MKRLVMKRVIVSIVLIMLFYVSEYAEAMAYTFTKIAQGVSGSASASINDAGTVVFGLPHGIFAGNGGPVSTLFDTSGPVQRFGAPAINNNGQIAFDATLDSGRQSIFIGSQSIASTGGRFPNDPILSHSFLFFGGPVAINNSGKVAFTGVLEFSNGNQLEGLFTGSLTSSVGLFVQGSSSGGFSNFGPPEINDNNTIIFGVSGLIYVFVGNGGQTSISNPSFRNPNAYTLNDHDAIAFSAELTTGGSGIFVKSGNALNRIADSLGPLDSLFNPSINDYGAVAFQANIDTGGMGIFTGPDVITDKVIQSGDTLLGVEVGQVLLAHRGLNNSGQIVFFAEGKSGGGALYRADPFIPLPPTPIPEPSTWLLLATGILSLLGSQGKRLRRL